MLQIRLMINYLCFPRYSKKTVLFDTIITIIINRFGLKDDKGEKQFDNCFVLVVSRKRNVIS